MLFDNNYTENSTQPSLNNVCYF